MTVRSRWTQWRRPERWTITQSADIVYQEVLKPRGYRRRGNNFYLEDFLHREVSFFAARWHAAHDRTLVVAFELKWVGLPDTLGGWHTVNESIGGSVRRGFRQPRVTDDTLDPRVIAMVKGPVLDFLVRPSSAQWVIDTILTTGALPIDRRCNPQGGTVGHATFAAWGAVALGDAERCAHALALAKSQSKDWSPDWHTGFADAIDRGWSELHGHPRP